jgi:hypothetical protein
MEDTVSRIAILIFILIAFITQPALSAPVITGTGEVLRIEP